MTYNKFSFYDADPDLAKKNFGNSFGPGPSESRQIIWIRIHAIIMQIRIEANNTDLDSNP